MFSTIYIEKAVIDYDRSRALLERFPSIPVVEIERYGEIFNRKAQNFRLQKQNPALILAAKHDNLVMRAPVNYGIGGRHHFYFSHMLNCIYDCRYCFLQGMFRSAHYLLFVNYEDFFAEVVNRSRQHANEYCTVYSGYDCDSLAMEPVTGFVDYFIPAIREHKNVILELRTKSTQVRQLLEMEVAENVVVAFSFTPREISTALEYKVPALEKRLDAMVKLQRHGWNVGVRFDPVIYDNHYKQLYSRLFDQIFAALDTEKLHSVSLGAFRLPEAYYQNMVKLYPREKLFSARLQRRDKMIAYQEDIEREMLEYCEQEILNRVDAQKYFPCEMSMPGKKQLEPETVA